MRKQLLQARKAVVWWLEIHGHADRLWNQITSGKLPPASMERESGSDSTAKSNEEGKHNIPLPTLTHLQFLVLDLLYGFPSGKSAQQVQEAMFQHGQSHRGPKFYQLMKRLEDAGLIESWHQEFDVAGTDVSRTYYKSTAAGNVARELTIQFYETRIRIQQKMNGTEEC